MPRRGRPVVIDGVEYPSMTAAAKATGLSTASVWMIATGAREPVGHKLRSNKCRPVVVDGVRYESIADARRATGLSNLTLRRIAAGVRPPTSKLLGMRPTAKGQPVTIMGKQYGSIREAADATGWSYSTVRKVALGLRDGDTPPKRGGRVATAALRAGGAPGGVERARALATLPPGSREMFALAWSNPSLTVEQIASAMGMARADVVRLARGLNLVDKA